MAIEILRRAASGNGNVSLDSVRNIADSKAFSATERELAAEVASTFGLTDLVAMHVGLPTTASIPELRDALARMMGLPAPKR